MLDTNNLSKVFTIGKGGENVKALNEINISVEEGSIFTLLGPSGCGKSTLLRSIAGLEEPTQGIIRLKDKDLYNSKTNINVVANKRNIGMVFQSYAIWPHMTVFENVAFPLKVPGSKFSKPEIKREVERALAIVQLDDLIDRQSTRLSGGQQQRLALARAIVTKPQLLLLDEPLSNLDAKLRESLRFELKKLQRDLGITTLYVTHDQNEALALSDKIAVMNKGEIQQIGTPREIYFEPHSRFVSDFIGTTNLIEGVIENVEASGLVKVNTDIGFIYCKRNDKYGPNDVVLISFRPEDIIVHDDSLKKMGLNTFNAIVTASIFSGDYSEVRIDVGIQQLKVKLYGERWLQGGDEIELTIKPDKALIVEKIGRGE